ncbi:DUF2161 domain-containing phosphodiesterase [Palleronia sp. LCG004]|uniref:DUF2161 domain-containing phosphodiesterase n=1 Tax=Palleronia sp. LCG004 TaxID=3079304 RepID=UPI002943F35F|nr:DUF2161 family putative PD-(D/E)XK-type phosphodiesterase [Palleronia sp. LCG004]WOI56455.1 DUF2161 family putative PD-(D/E)XK-type phosphodiesterase [Palleronia sp. LCG004]
MTARETDLYAPLKAFLESQGYEVKGEVGRVDLMAVRGAEPPVLVEMKLSFTLSLVHQGIDRQALSDWVYLAVPHPKGGVRKRPLALCRRLGLGLVTVRMNDALVTVHCDPAPFAPRRFPARQGRLLREFARLEGDPNIGGGTRRGLMTAYRQDALRCAAHLAVEGPARGAETARATGVATATRIMRDNHHGWFRKVRTGVYDLSEAGHRAIPDRD